MTRSRGAKEHREKRAKETHKTENVLLGRLCSSCCRFVLSSRARELFIFILSPSPLHPLSAHPNANLLTHRMIYECWRFKGNELRIITFSPLILPHDECELLGNCFVPRFQGRAERWWHVKASACHISTKSSAPLKLFCLLCQMASGVVRFSGFHRMLTECYSFRVWGETTEWKLLGRETIHDDHSIWLNSSRSVVQSNNQSFWYLTTFSFAPSRLIKASKREKKSFGTFREIFFKLRIFHHSWQFFSFQLTSDSGDDIFSVSLTSHPARVKQLVKFLDVSHRCKASNPLEGAWKFNWNFLWFQGFLSIVSMERLKLWFSLKLCCDRIVLVLKKWMLLWLTLFSSQ